MIVKLSSLGDVIHALPAVADIQRALPGTQIDWVVERAFAPLVRREGGIGQVIACDLRAWRRAPFSAATRLAWKAFRAELRSQCYDAVIDLQGLTKSALVARLARLAPGGHRYALGNRTDGAGWEPVTRWVADRPIDIEPHVHAVPRSRQLCARALGYPMPETLAYGLTTHSPPDASAATTVVFLHGSSRADKEWPLTHWQQLGARLLAAGWRIVLAHGNAEEQARSAQLAELLVAGDDSLRPRVEVWPRLALDALADRLAPCAGAIGVDSGPSHLAVALGLPHVQIYRHPTSWRTGPIGHPRQCSVEDALPTVDQVEAAWQDMLK